MQVWCSVSMLMPASLWMPVQLWPWREWSTTCVSMMCLELMCWVHKKLIAVIIYMTLKLRITAMIATCTSEDIYLQMRWWCFFCIGLGNDEPVFADGEVITFGQIIGIVLASSQPLAQRATRAVRVTYHDLPSIITIEVWGREGGLEIVCN